MFPGQFQYPAQELERFNHYVKALSEELGVIEGIGTLSGIKLDPAMIPRHPQMQFKAQQLPDFVNAAPCWLLSGRAKSIIERLEPGVHQFIEMELTQKDGRPWPHPYWAFNMCNRLDTAVAEEHSNCFRMGADKPFWRFGFPMGPRKLAFHKAMVKDLTFWVDRRLSGIFMSDKFMSALHDAGITEVKSHLFTGHIAEV